MIVNKQNRNDIIKYYQGTIVKFKETGDHVWKINKVTTDEIYCSDANGFEVCIDLNEDYEIDYPLPSRAVYQSGVIACCLLRIPARQYYRGLSPDNTHIKHLTMDGKWLPKGIELITIQEFVDKPSYQSVSFLEKGYASYALSPQIALTALGHLFCITRLIGKINLEKKTGNVDSLFRDEVSLLFPNYKVNYV